MPDPALTPFRRAWLIATFAGWAIGLIAAIVLIIAVDSVGPSLLTPLGIGMGVCIGLAQRRPAQRYLNIEKGWTRATLLGVSCPLAVYDILHVNLTLTLHLATVVAAAGVFTGLFQWLLLRSRFERAWLWIPTSTVAWAIAASTIFFNDKYLPLVPGILGALLYIGVIWLGGIVLGIIGGTALDRIRAPDAPPSAERAEAPTRPRHL